MCLLMFTASIESKDAVEPDAIPVVGLCCLITSYFGKFKPSYAHTNSFTSLLNGNFTTTYFILQRFATDVWPECFGVDIKMIFCCLELDCRYCKPRNPNSDRPDRPDRCFVISDGTNSSIKPKTLLRGHTRLCCLNQRCAIPIDEEVPCIFNFCGLTLFYKGVGSLQCCVNFMKLEEIAYKGL